MAPPHRRRAAVAVRALVALTALLCTTGLAPAATSGPAARAAVAEVPPPTATTSVVTVRTGGDRTADAEVGPLAGVTLGLFADEGATDPVDPDWGVCVSDTDGDCSFTVPGTGPGGPNEGAVYTVRQIAAPSGWYTNPELRTGPGSGSGSLSPAYAFPTPELEGGQTYSSTSDFMYSTEYRESPFTASTGIWQQSRNNPPLNGACGIDVALVLDLSASVGSALPQLKDAADQFTDALAGTPSRLSLFSFDRNSPSTGTENHPEPTSVSTQAGADAFKSLYADWDLGSGTNWDQGLYAVAKAPTRYDLTVVLTDGNPTRFSKPIEGDGSRTHFADTEGGIFAANAVKAQGTRVVAVGVGRGVEGVSGLNLRAISGPEAFTGDNPETADYYQTTDFTAAGAALNQLALSNCAGTVSVIKQIVPESNTGEDVSGSRNAGPGWEFTASSTEPLGGLPDTRATDDDGTGGVTFEPEFPPTTGEAPVTVEETQQPNHTLVTQGGANAVCVNLDDGASVPVTNSGPTGFTVDLARQGGVSCTVYNRPDPSQAGRPDRRQALDHRRHDIRRGRPARRQRSHPHPHRSGRRRSHPAALGHHPCRLPTGRHRHRRRGGHPRPRLPARLPRGHGDQRRPGHRRTPLRGPAHPRAHRADRHQHPDLPPRRGRPDRRQALDHRRHDVRRGRPARRLRGHPHPHRSGRRRCHPAALGHAAHRLRPG
ncbi:vWA domain-containing protein [Streptomyces albidoflavus]